MRSALSPSFTSSKMKAMFHLMCASTEKFIEYFKKEKKDVIEVEIKDVLSRFGNDVIASVIFGIEVDSLNDKNNQFYLLGKDITNFTDFWKMMKFFGYILAPKFFDVSLVLL